MSNTDNCNGKNEAAYSFYFPPHFKILQLRMDFQLRKQRKVTQRKVYWVW